MNGYDFCELVERFNINQDDIDAIFDFAERVDEAERYISKFHLN